MDYLVIGHITQDVTPQGLTLGGTVTYSARTALALGCAVGVVTSTAANLNLDNTFAGISIACQPSQSTTTFENIYTPAGRRQVIHARAAPLDFSAVPGKWQSSGIVHLAPLAGECAPELIECFPGALIAVTPQGWMRHWDDAGNVSVGEWPQAAKWLPQVGAAVISQEDVANDPETIAQFAQLAPILVVTSGEQGCVVYVRGEKRHIPVSPRPSIDPTGAGDIFAAAFFVRLQQTNNPWLSAQFANALAALSVERSGWQATPTAADVNALEICPIGQLGVA